MTESEAHPPSVADTSVGPNLLGISDGEQLAAVLRTLQLLPGSDTGGAVDPARQQLEDYKLRISKTVGIAVSGSGGLGAVVTLIGAALASFKDQVGEPITLSLILGGAAVLIASILALSLVMQADVRGRAAVSTQVVEGRERVTASILQTLERLPVPPAAAATPTSGSKVAVDAERASLRATQLLLAIAGFHADLVIPTDSAAQPRVTGVRRRGDRVQFRQADGDWVDVSEVDDFETR